jgi:predicted kinase
MKLILFSGLPGTGKSSLARQVASKFSFPLFNKDYFESILYNNKFTEGKSVHGYHLLLETAELQLSLGLSLVLDAVFPRVGFRERVRDMAKQFGAKLYIIHTYCSDEKVHQKRLINRVSQVPWTAVNWERVQEIRSFYTIWQENEILSLDAINPLQDNLQCVLDYIRN